MEARLPMAASLWLEDLCVCLAADNSGQSS